jgi:hypothetical protein
VRRASVLAAGAAALALALAAPAAAHGPTATRGGYISHISALQPSMLGVLVNVIGTDDWLRLSNYSGKEIVILGYQGEPYLRFDGTGVFQNVRSPAVYVNKLRGFGGLVPDHADATALPEWRKVAGGASFKWRDHRIYWARQEPPPGVQKNPDRIQKVFDWRVPGRADGSPFAITGILGYAPPLGSPDDGRNWALSAFVAAAVLLTVLAVIGLWVAHRRSRRATQP